MLVSPYIQMFLHLARDCFMIAAWCLPYVGQSSSLADEHIKLSVTQARLGATLPVEIGAAISKPGHVSQGAAVAHYVSAGGSLLCQVRHRFCSVF